MKMPKYETTSENIVKMMKVFIKTYEDVPDEAEYKFTGEQLHKLCDSISYLLLRW